LEKGSDGNLLNGDMEQQKPGEQKRRKRKHEPPAPTEKGKGSSSPHSFGTRVLDHFSGGEGGRRSLVATNGLGWHIWSHHRGAAEDGSGDHAVAGKRGGSMKQSFLYIKLPGRRWGWWGIQMNQGPKVSRAHYGLASEYN